MSRARTPNKRILEAILDSPVNLIAHVLNSAVVPDDQGLAEVGIDTLSLRVDSDQVQFFPTSVDDLFDAEIEFAAHDDRVGFSSQAVEEVEADAVDFVVDVETLDVGSVISHDYVDELIDGGWSC
jgi:hypothetical protein